MQPAVGRFPFFAWDVGFAAHVAWPCNWTSIPHALIPAHLLADIRQCIRYQYKNGGFGCLSKSVPFWYNGDRVLIGDEIFMGHGWGPEIKTAEVTRYCHGLQGVPKKKPRTIRFVNLKVTDLAGCGVNLADMACVVHSAILAIDAPDLFATKPEDVFPSAETTSLGVGDGTGMMHINETTNPSQIHAAMRDRYSPLSGDLFGAMCAGNDVADGVDAAADASD